MSRERESRRVWQRLARRSRNIFDIEANTGIYSILASVANPDAAVTAFEPLPNIFRVLELHSRLNGFEWCCNNLALGDSQGLAQFYNCGEQAFTGNTTAGRLNNSWRPVGQKSIEVRVTTLANYLERTGGPPPDLVKVDVEAYEVEVLCGCESLLQRHSPVFLMEIQSAEILVGVRELLPPTTNSMMQIIEGEGQEEVATPVLGGTDLNCLFIPCNRLPELGPAWAFRSEAPLATRKMISRIHLHQ